MKINNTDYKILFLTTILMMVILVTVLLHISGENNKLRIENENLVDSNKELTKELEISNEIFNKQANFYTSLFLKLRKNLK